MTFYVQYPQRPNCANLRFGGKQAYLLTSRAGAQTEAFPIFVPAADGLKVITVGFEPTSFSPTRTNTLRIMTFRAYPYLHYRYATLSTSLSWNPPGHIAAVQRLS